LEKAKTVQEFFDGVAKVQNLLTRVTTLQESAYAADLKSRVSDAYLNVLKEKELIDELKSESDGFINYIKALETGIAAENAKIAAAKGKDDEDLVKAVSTAAITALTATKTDNSVTAAERLREYTDRKAIYDFGIKRETKRFELEVRKESGNIKLDNKIYVYKMVTDIWDKVSKGLMAQVTDEDRKKEYQALIEKTTNADTRMGYTVEIELLENNIADRKAAIKERNEELKEEEEAFNTRKVEAELQAAIAK